MATGRAHTPWVKICGLTRAQDVEGAIHAGADMLGFVFDRGPCAVSVPLATELVAMARAMAPEACCVAVIGGLGPRERRRIAGLGFDSMQMEASAYVPSEDAAPWALPAFFDDGSLRTRVCAFRRAHAPRFSALGTGARPEGPRGRLRGLVNVDGRGGGGTGTRTDWNAARSLAQEGPLMLAGGLTADNVRDAIRQVAPLAVDVSTGVESAPGRKDLARMVAFVAAVRG